MPMEPMFVTLEVSKLSGWLKADAPGRVEGRACDAGGERGGSRKVGGPVWCGGGTTRGMHWDDPTQGLGAKRARAERTPNMLLMVVTLEVSKLSGWLKADAYCHVEGRACDAGGERWKRGGGRACGVVAAQQAACTAREKARLKACGPRGHARSARRTCSTWS